MLYRTTRCQKVPVRFSLLGTVQTTLTMTYLSRKGAQLALGFLLLLGLSSARADLQFLDFSGGNGTPLTITFDTPIVFDVTVAPTREAPFFVIGGLGDLFQTGQRSITSTASFDINGGTAYGLDTIGSALSFADLSADDVYLYNSSQVGSYSTAISLGDRIVLRAGTITTAGNFDGDAPTQGFYDVFMLQNDGAKISTGVAIPEPATTALWLGGLGLVGAVIYRRRTRRG